MPFTLPPNTVTLWQINWKLLPINHFLPHGHIYTSWLSTEEQHNAHTIKQENDYFRYIVGRTALRYISGHYLTTQGQTLHISTTTHGKPYWSQHPTLHFNISHSGDYITLAFYKEAPVGVDIQKITSRRHTIMRIAQHRFADDEINLLTSLSPARQEDEFFTIWARKEAVIKSTGRGIYQNMQDFSVLPTSHAPQWHTLTTSHTTGTTPIQLTSLFCTQNYKVALAVQSPNIPLLKHYETTDINWNDLISDFG